jgi:hypothetical protein
MNDTIRKIIGIWKDVIGVGNKETLKRIVHNEPILKANNNLS